MFFSEPGEGMFRCRIGRRGGLGVLISTLVLALCVYRLWPDAPLQYAQVTRDKNTVVLPAAGKLL